MLIPSLFERLQIANWLLHSETYLPIAALLLRCELFIWLTPRHTSHSLVIAQPHYCTGLMGANRVHWVWKADILKLPILSSYEDCTVGRFIDKLVIPICPHKQNGCDKIKNKWNLPIKSTWGLRGRVHLLEGGPFKYNVSINNNLMGGLDHKEMWNEICYGIHCNPCL